VYQGGGKQVEKIQRKKKKGKKSRLSESKEHEEKKGDHLVPLWTKKKRVLDNPDEKTWRRVEMLKMGEMWNAWVVRKI